MNVSTQTMTRYLLGELPAEEQAAFEKAYFDDPRLFADVSDAETALIDDYVRGRLAPEIRQRFEQVYLTDPRRRERVEFAEALIARADAAAGPATRARMPLAYLALAATVVLAIAAGLIWFVAPSSRPRQESTQGGGTAPGAPVAPAAPAPAAPGAPGAPEHRTAPSAPVAPSAPSAPSAPVPAATLALVLAPGVRSAETPSPAMLEIPAGAQEVRIALTIRDSESQRHRVILHAVGGAEVVRRDFTLRPAATGAALTLTLAASALPSGDYVLTLQGAERSGEFDDLIQKVIRVEKPAR